MSYRGLGADASPHLEVGQLAREDPFMAAASLMATRVMLRVARARPSARQVTLERAMEELYPGLAKKTSVEYAKLLRTRKPDQALFDAIRLTIANRIAEHMAPAVYGRADLGREVRGLGDFASDTRAVACFMGSTSAQAGGWLGAFRDGAQNAIFQGATTGATIASCNLPQLELQARTAEAQGQRAIELARIQSAQTVTTGRTIMIGVVGLAVIGIGAVLLRK